MADTGDKGRQTGRAQSSRGAQPTYRRAQQQRGGQQRRPSQPRYSKQEILRNRIIAVVVLVALLALAIGLVTCVARGLSGSGDTQASSASNAAASAAASEASASQSADQAADQASGQAATAAAAGVDDPWVEGGRFTTGDAELDQIVKDWCDGNSRDDLDAADNAFNAYCGAMWADFIERDDNQYPWGESWDITYAKQIMTEGGGNCYEQAAIGEFILKYFGYTEVYAEPCFILRQSGEYGNHGLLYVTDKDGRKCLCDPAFGANGWMLDADIYTVKLIDIGQDRAELTIAPFEEVVPAPWADLV